MSPKILISGFYCGPSPSAGLGIAKSLRDAWPEATIIGMDYWNGASGLHDASLTERLVFPSWDLLDHSLHAQTIRDFSDTHFILSALDIEVAWLSQNVLPNPHLLIPTKSSLHFAYKPFVRIAGFLPFKTPDIYIENGDDQALYDFCREHSWRIWVKGPYHGAQFVSCWRDLDNARLKLANAGSYAHVFYQAHVRGLEESICFSAIDGKLCGAVHMQKRVTTVDGKTWSGKIRPLSKRQLDIVSDAVLQIKWTGGGEFELIRDESETFWLMEFNPRFPAWIYGSTIAGINLPALLVAEASGISMVANKNPTTDEFTRIVTEIPVLSYISLPQATQPEHGQVTALGKYGASFGQLESDILESQNTQGNTRADVLAPAENGPTASLEEANWAKIATEQNSTPVRICLESKVASRFASAKVINSVLGGGCKLNVAYSIKTCPDKLYMTEAFNCGLMAEAISLAEVEHALTFGWERHQIILNGPAKWWPRTIDDNQGLAAVFCDSLDEFERLIRSDRQDKVWGLRLKIPGFGSRFGAELDSYDDLARATSLIQRVPAGIKLGFHVHMASNLIGKGHWQDAVESAIGWATTISAHAGRDIAMIDFGGGYHPRDFSHVPWSELMSFAKARIPSLESVTIEPGRALSQDTMLMVTSIQDIRRRGGEVSEVVVDTCISELPLARVYPHRMFVLNELKMEVIGAGRARILGRICMEDDILADGVSFPKSTKIGDRIIIADAGAYERSMSYEFGYGRVSQSF